MSVRGSATPGRDRRVPRPLAALAAAAVAVGACAGSTSAAPAAQGGLSADRAGCARPYSEASPWNTPVPARPRLHPRTAVHVAAIQGLLSSDPTQYTYPVYEVTSATPRQAVALSGQYSEVSLGGRRLVRRRGGHVQLPIPDGARPAAGKDAQAIFLDRSTGDEWGVFRLVRGEDGSWSGRNAYRYNTRWSGVPPKDRHGAAFASRGAGVPYLAGLVRRCEIDRGRIDHALAFAYDYPTAEHVYPATKSDGDSRDAADLPEGSRLQLDPALTAAQIKAWGCRGACLTIARALQRYGMYVVDNSGRPKIIVEYEETARWRGLITARTVRPIPISAFRVLAPARPPRHHR